MESSEHRGKKLKANNGTKDRRGSGGNRIRKHTVFYFSSSGNLAPPSAVMKLAPRVLKEERLVPEGAIIPTKRIERI